MAARISSGPGPVVRNLVCPGALGCTGDEMEVCVNFNNIDLGLFVEHVGVCDLSSAVCDLTAAERALYVGFCEESCESESDFYFVDAAAATERSTPVPIPASLLLFDTAAAVCESVPVDVVVKFDTGCSRNMSGVPGRLHTTSTTQASVQGFNGALERVDAVGTNADSRMEYFLSSMPRNLVLLSGHEYAKEGAAVLFPEDGRVVRLTAEEQAALREFLRPFPTVKELIVKNRTYEVRAAAADSNMCAEEAHSSTATRFFNSKINVSNQQERVLAHLLTGMSFKDTYSALRSGSIAGLPRDLTLQALNNYEHNFGTNPPILQLARPNLAGNTKGYHAPKPVLSHVGQRVEADFMECEINDVVPANAAGARRPAAVKSSPAPRARKLATHGGAIAAFVSVDSYSGFVIGHLVTSTGNCVAQVEYVNAKYQTAGHRIHLFAADQGVLSQSHFQVMTPAVEQYLQDNRIESECAMPHDHNYGTSRIERTVRTVHELIRFALLYILHNPNFPTFGFTKIQVLKLWGELFYWAIMLINLKQSPADKLKTKYEVFYHRKPDLRDHPLLPIFSSLYVLRVSGNATLNSAHQFWQKGLYVGPSRKTVGAVRVAVVTNGTLNILTTSNIKAVSDGGDNDPYLTADRAVSQTIADLHAVPLPTTTSIDAQRPEPTVRGSAATSAPAALLPPLPVPGTPPDHSRVPAGVPVPLVPVPSVPGFPPLPDPEGAPVPVIPTPHIIPVSDTYVSDFQSIDPVTTAQSNTHLRTTAVVSPTTVPASTPVNVLPVRKSFSLPASSISTTPDLPANPVSTKHPTRKSAAPKAKAYNPNLPSRSRAARYAAHQMSAEFNGKTVASFLATCTATTPLVEECCFIDWSTHTAESCYLSFSTGQFIIITDALPPPVEPTDVSYRAVKGPTTFAAAMTDPAWREAATKEFSQVISENTTVVSFDVEEARRLVASGEAQVLWLIPVYEEKIKEGATVRKVRLVADGRQHTKHGPTYAPTPSRSELFTLLHLFATHNLDYFHVDEIRAFLSAKRQDEHVVFARLRGDPHYWKILNALYGMKTASRDHQIATINKLLELGFERCGMCTCIYQYRKNGVFLVVYVYVDDFIFGGKPTLAVSEKIADFRKLANTTEPIMNAPLLIGMEIERIPEKRVILIRMRNRINDLCKRFPYTIVKRNTVTPECPEGKVRTCRVPMPVTGYLVEDHEFENKPSEQQRYLTKKEVEVYMSIIGCLIWIQGVRMDIIFAVLYLSWFTKKPRVHHLDMAEYCIAYLNTTKDIPLVLGGEHPVRIIGYTDASLGTGPHSRSVTGEIIKLNEHAGAISAKASAGHTVLQSSFEAELYGMVNVLKSVAGERNVLDSINTDYESPSLVYTDNEAMLKFVKGEGSARGVRHMAMRMWYARDEFSKHNVEGIHMPGVIIPTDKLTKLGNVEEHRIFMRKIQGLDLVGPDFVG